MIRYGIILFSLGLILISNISCKMQSKTLTDGNARYYDQAEAKVYEKGFSQMVDYEKLRDKPLLIRLDEEEEKIAALKRVGREEQATKHKKRLDERNAEVAAAIIEHYQSDNYYFYYASDADSIFIKKQFNLLYKDLAKPVTEVDDIEDAYVLMYRTTPELKEGKRFIVHYWDGEKMERLKGYYKFRSYYSIFSAKVNYPKTIKTFCELVWN